MMKNIYFSKTNLKKHSLMLLILFALISFNALASNSKGGGFSEFLDKTVGSIENPQNNQSPQKQNDKNQNNQSSDTWSPSPYTGGYYNDGNNSSPSNKNPSQNNWASQNMNNQSPRTNNPPQNNAGNNQPTYNGTFTQNYTSNPALDNGKGGPINADIPVGVKRFGSQRDQNIYLDGIQDYVDGFVDQDGNPIQKGQAAPAQKPPVNNNNSTYNSKHNRK